MCPGGYGIRPYVCAASLRASNARPYKGGFIMKKRLLHKEKIQVQQPLYG